MEKLPKIICASLVGLFALTTSVVQAQTTPKWFPRVPSKETPQPQPSGQSLPEVILGESRPVIVDRDPNDRRYPNDRRDRTYRRDRDYDRDRYDDDRYGKRKGHPHGMPPGQAKKQGYRSGNGGMPPGQAKKYNDGYRGYGKGKGKYKD